MIPSFLCPADIGTAVDAGFGPLNYAACTGDGTDGGSPFQTNGIFYINSKTRLRDITDGLSKTVALSESTLGSGAESFSGTLSQIDPQAAYAYVFGTPLTDGNCNSAVNFNWTNRRGYAWVNGEYRCGLFNNYLEPNAQRIDCVASVLNTSDPTQIYAGYGCAHRTQPACWGRERIAGRRIGPFHSRRGQPENLAGHFHRAGGEAVVDPTH